MPALPIPLNRSAKLNLINKPVYSCTGKLASESPNISMDQSLKDKIYTAQCLADVEPIEYMVPYPNIASIVDGMIVKHSNKMLYADQGWTRFDFHNKVKQAANWLSNKGVYPKERVYLADLPSPDAELLAFAVWTLGASLVIADESASEEAEKITDASFSILESPFPDCFNNQPDTFDPTYIPLLSDEAMVYCRAENSIRLSHYNILVNTYAVEKGLKLTDDSVIYSELKPDGTAWAVLQAVLPLYCGGSFSKENPNCRFGKDFSLVDGPQSLKNLRSDDVCIFPENTAVLSIGSEPIHMTGIKEENQMFLIEGHSVMMGYLENELNQQHFQNGSFCHKKNNR